MARQPYPSDLSDAAWRLIEPYVHESANHSGKQPVDRREILNAIFWIVRTGAQWRYMPHDLPNWRTAYEYFVQWAEDGTWERIEHDLRPLARSASGRSSPATLGIIDSQTARTTESGGPRGYDGNKKMLGRKRNLIVDSLGMPIAHLVNPANVHDSQPAPDLIREAKRREPDLKVIIGDKAYRGEPLRRVAADIGVRIEIVEADGRISRFVPLRHRWKVERSFAWHGRNRRLSKDYERTIESSETAMTEASIAILLRRDNSNSPRKQSIKL